MHRKPARARIPRRQPPHRLPAGKLIALLASLALIASFALSLTAATACTQGGTAAAVGGIEGLKQAVADYAATSGEGLSAPEVASFLNDYDNNTGIFATPSFGAEYPFNPASTAYISATALSEGKFAVAYRDIGNSNYGTAIIGNVTGNVIAFGAEYVFNPAATYNISTTALTQGKFAVAYTDEGNSYYGTAIIGNVTGNVIAFGAEYVFNPTVTGSISATALTGSKFAVAYQDSGSSSYGTALIGDVTGNVIAFGAEYVFNSAGTNYISATALTESKFTATYCDLGGGAFHGTAVIGGVSGTTIAFGSEYVFNEAYSANTDNISATTLLENKFAVAYRDGATSGYGTAVIGDVTGNAIAFGTEYFFNMAGTYNISATAISGSRFAVAYRDTGNSSYGTAIIGDVMGNVVTLGTEYSFNSAGTYYISVATLTEGKFAIAYEDAGNSAYGTAVIGGIDPPTVATDPATSITSSGATLNGEITSVGGEECDQRGFRYRVQGAATWQEWHESTGPYGTGAFGHALSGLSPGTTYEFRARAHNTGGWGEGGVLTFTTAPSYSFYFAEGYTGSGFQEYICLGNPGTDALDVDVTFLFKGGGTQAETYTVPAQSRLTVDVNQEVGEGKDVSIVISAASPYVAERPMYFTYGAGWTGGHDAVGAPSPSTTWYFAEGYTGAGFDEYICVLNPGADDAELTFRFQTPGGEQVVGGQTVPAHSRETFSANLLLGGAYEASLALESTQPVVAERPMYFNYTGYGAPGWNGGHCVMGASSLANEYFFAEGYTGAGFDEYLTIQNPNTEDIVVQATYQLGAGQGGPLSASYPVPAEGRTTVYVNAPAPAGVGPGVDVSVHLTCPEDFLAERPMYFNYSGMGPHAWTGGHCVIGATGAADTWFFAEGYTGAGFEEWICIQNPGDTAADVTIIYYPEGGGDPIVCPQPQVGANSRYTAYVNGPANAGPDRAVSAMVGSDQPVICERPMYFDFFGLTGGHDVVGFVP